MNTYWYEHDTRWLYGFPYKLETFGSMQRIQAWALYDPVDKTLTTYFRGSDKAEDTKYYDNVDSDDFDKLFKTLLEVGELGAYSGKT